MVTVDGSSHILGHRNFKRLRLTASYYSRIDVEKQLHMHLIHADPASNI